MALKISPDARAFIVPAWITDYSETCGKDGMDMKRICKGCGEERDCEQDFNWKYKVRGIRHSRCKYCVSQVSKQHYQDNKQSYMERIHTRDKKILQDNRGKLAAYLAQHPCIDCGQTDIRVLDLDHVRGTKREAIARMVRLSYSWSTIESEIDKCEVRCANCHRIKTGQTSNSWRNFFLTLEERILPDPVRSSNAFRAMQTRVENMQKIHFYLSSHPCVDCGNSDIRVLEFDHVRGEKYENISRMIQSSPWKAIEAEIAKCEVRCANCHRIQTIERGQWWRTDPVE